MNPKITPAHQTKPAYIYIRQSTLGQVRHHQESTERQYALQDKALALGWPQQSMPVEIRPRQARDLQREHRSHLAHRDVGHQRLEVLAALHLRA